MAKGVKIGEKSYLEGPPSREKKQSVTRQNKIKGLTLHVGEIIIYAFVILFLSAGTYCRNKIWNSDVEIWTDCVKKSPNKDRPHLKLGEIFIRQGRHQEAIAQFAEALRINPDYAEAHLNLGATFIFQRRYQEAVAQYTEALRVKPHYAEAHYSLGVVLSYQGRYEEAIAQFIETLKISSDLRLEWYARYNLVISYLAIGHRDSALKEYEILKAKNPGLASALYEKIK